MHSRKTKRNEAQRRNSKLKKSGGEQKENGRLRQVIGLGTGERSTKIIIKENKIKGGNVGEETWGGKG